MKPSMLRFAIGILIGLHIGKFGCKIYQEQDVFHERRYLVTAMPSIHFNCANSFRVYIKVFYGQTMLRNGKPNSILLRIREETRHTI